MKKEIIEFGKRMDAAADKALLVDHAEGSRFVLDLGAGTGKIARDIAEKWGSHVDAVDIQFKDNCQNSDNITYYGVSIKDFFEQNIYGNTKYDCIILSAILHELCPDDLHILEKYLPAVMADNCRILIREPFHDDILGPVKAEDSRQFIKLTSDNIAAGKLIEFLNTTKLHLPGSTLRTMTNFDRAWEWANLAFTISYGEQSWEREKHEFRYARSLNWCKDFFNRVRSFTGFQVYPILDTSYRRHFINANIPAAAFDLIQYTGMLVVIDYSK